MSRSQLLMMPMRARHHCQPLQGHVQHAFLRLVAVVQSFQRHALRIERLTVEMHEPNEFVDRHLREGVGAVQSRYHERNSNGHVRR